MRRDSNRFDAKKSTIRQHVRALNKSWWIDPESTIKQHIS